MPVKPIAILAGVAGNLMEWYDFVLYGVLAPTLCTLFFPQSNHLLSVLSVFGVFAVGYIMRLAGGAFFRHLADHHGRRTALMLSAILMAVSTALVGILPVHVTISIVPPPLHLLQAHAGALGGRGVCHIDTCRWKTPRATSGRFTEASLFLPPAGASC